MEKVETPEHRCFHWCYAESLTVYLGVDAQWNNNRVFPRKSGSKPGWLGESSLRNQFLTDDIYFFKLLDAAEGLYYLHANHTMHGDLKGAGSYSISFSAASIILHQPNILVDHSSHACLTDFGFASVVRGLRSILVTEVQGYSARWAALEVLESGDRNTREADIFAFGMVVVEASHCIFLHQRLMWEDIWFCLILKPCIGLHRKVSLQRVLSLGYHIEDHGR